MKKLITSLLHSKLPILFLVVSLSPANVLAVPNWTEQSPSTVPPARSDFGMSFNSTDNSVIIFGGDNGSSGTNDTWVFNGTNWSRLSTTGTPAARDGISLVYDAESEFTDVRW